MAFVKKHLGNIIFFVIFSYILIKQSPVWINSYQQEGKSINASKVDKLDGGVFEIPIKNKKAVYLFWATWCGPCHIQMDSFKGAVNSGEINKDQVIAVNLGEPITKVKAFQSKNNYPFQIVVSRSMTAWADFGVVATPSIAYVSEKGIIKEFTSGVAPLAVFKSKRFLR